AHTMLISNLRLLSSCQRDAPGAALQLHIEQFWSHGCFAVRGQSRAIGICEALHPIEVVSQLLFVQNCRRQGEVFMQQIPAKTCYISFLERPIKKAEPFLD